MHACITPVDRVVLHNVGDMLHLRDLRRNTRDLSVFDHQMIDGDQVNFNFSS